MLVLLDTTVLIDYLRGRRAVGRVNALIDQGDPLCTTPINVEEVVRGLRPEEIPAVDALFDGLRIVPIGREEGRRAGEWRRRFAGRGTTLSQADCLIAAARVLDFGPARNRQSAALPDDRDRGRALAGRGVSGSSRDCDAICPRPVARETTHITGSVLARQKSSRACGR